MVSEGRRPTVANGRPRALLLGVDPPTLRAAAALGIDVLVVEDASSRDFGFKVVPAGLPVVFVEDLADVGRVYAALERSGHLSTPFDSVTTTEEYAVVSAAVIARLIGARGHDPLTALYYRDKALQKGRLRAAGIATARAVVVDDIRQPTALADVDFDEAVLKPIAGCGTQFTRRVATRELAAALAALARSSGCPRTFLVEEFVAGDEWHADGIVFGGGLRFVSLTRYGEPCLDAVAGDRPVTNIMLDQLDDRAAYDLVVPVLEAALTALGPLDGAFHMEVFVHDHRVTFGECAARRGGGMIQEGVEVKHGVDLAAAALEAGIGSEPSLHVVRNPRPVGSTNLPCPAGILLAAPSEKEIAAQEGVEVAWVQMPVGYVMPGSSPTAIFKVGAAVVSAPDVERLEANLHELLAWFREGVWVAPPSATRAELRALESQFRARG